MNDLLQKKTDIGLIRDKNEDSCCALSHPKNKNIKMLAVADGMGGKDLGDVASSYVINSLVKWFKKESLELLSNFDKLAEFLNAFLQNINEDLIYKYGENRLGTTLTLTIVSESNTLLLNVGDSRCYTYDGTKLKQVSEDDSQVWYYYKSGQAGKEDLRFFSTSNIICSCIGLNNDLCTSKKTIIKNDDYNLLLLVTDGVTDLLTDNKILEIIEKYKNKKHEILDKIIQEAVYKDQNLRVPLRLKRAFKETFYIPSHGKDNATGVIFIK